MQIDPAAADRIAGLAAIFKLSEAQVVSFGITMISHVEPGAIVWLLRVTSMPENQQAAIFERLTSPQNRRAAEHGAAA